ncbi:MAG: hypothetical protein AAB038_02030 [Planctomycetota bacterium]
MSRTILIVIGILCAVITAAGSIYLLTYDPEYQHKEVLSVTTYVLPTANKLDECLFSTHDESAPPITLTDNNNPITPFIIPGEITMDESVNAMNIQEAKNLEKLVLERINKIMRLKDRQEGVKARAEIRFFPNQKLVNYQLYIYKDLYSGSFYDIKCRKDSNKWIIIDDGNGSIGSFQMTHCFQGRY